jgi:hypothetical protein
LLLLNRFSAKGKGRDLPHPGGNGAARRIISLHPALLGD